MNKVVSKPVRMLFKAHPIALVHQIFHRYVFTEIFNVLVLIFKLNRFELEMRSKWVDEEVVASQ